VKLSSPPSGLILEEGPTPSSYIHRSSAAREKVGNGGPGMRFTSPLKEDKGFFLGKKKGGKQFRCISLPGRNERVRYGKKEGEGFSVE